MTKSVDAGPHCRRAGRRSARARPAPRWRAPGLLVSRSWSRELKRGRALPARFAGEPIVLVRGKNGAVFALEDRCAHRQVPLSKGVVQGATIRCCYHGWSYDGSGRCVDIPYLGKGKLPNGVRSYPCRDTGALILVFPGNVARAVQVPPPAMAAAAIAVTRPAGSAARSPATTVSCTRT